MKRIVIVVIMLIQNLAAYAQYEHVVVFLNPVEISNENTNRAKVESHKKFVEHIKNQEAVFYGVLDNGSEVMIFENNSVDDVMSMIQTSTLVADEIIQAQPFKVMLRKGEFCKAAEEGKFEIHNFVRYASHITKYNIQQVPQLLKMHDDYIKKITRTGNVLSEAVFSNSDGGFLIVKGALGRDVIFNDPTYVAGFIHPTINNIRVRQGIICKDK